MFHFTHKRQLFIMTKGMSGFQTCINIKYKRMLSCGMGDIGSVLCSIADLVCDFRFVT